MPSLVRHSLRFLYPLSEFAAIGGFLAGLVIPHENGFAISLVEKIEDLVSILFLPLVCLRLSTSLHDGLISA